MSDVGGYKNALKWQELCPKAKTRHKILTLSSHSLGIHEQAKVPEDLGNLKRLF